MKQKQKQKTKATAIYKKLIAKGTTDSSHVSRVINKGWRVGSACSFIHSMIKNGKSTKVIVAAINKTPYKLQGCFNTTDKATARIETIRRQAKQLGI